jgi:hypothetical protein
MPQWHTGGIRRRVRNCHRNRYRSITAKATLLRGAIKCNQCLVDLSLVGGIYSAQGRGNLPRNICLRLSYIEAVEGGPAITQIERLTASYRRTRRRDCASSCSAGENNFSFDGRSAA